MAKITLEESTSRGGNAAPSFPGQTYFSYRKTYIVWESVNNIIAEEYYDFYVYDEREVEYELGNPYLIEPLEDFYQETLPNGDIRHYSYDRVKVTYTDEVVNDEEDCTLAISGVTVQKSSFDGTADGTATINTIGAQGSLLYSLDNINWQASPTFTGLKPQIYQAYVKDGRVPLPCTADTEFSLDRETNAPVCDLQILNVVLTKIGQQYQVTVTSSSSYQPVNYTLNGVTNQTGIFSIGQPGQHDLKAVDRAKCEASTTVSIGQTIPERIDFSLNPIFFEVSASAAGREIELDLWVETEHYKGDYQKIITRRKPALRDGKCKFSLESLLHTILNQAEEKLDLINRPNQLCRHGILNYFLSWSEVDPFTGLAAVKIYSGLRTVKKGGIPPQDLTEENFFSGYLQRTKQFLTWLPATVKIGASQPEFIYFLLQRNVTSVTIQRHFRSVGSEVVSTEALAIPAGTSMYRVICVPVFRGVLAPGTTQIEVTLFDQANGILSENQIYKIDWSYQLFEKYFLFENSLGVWQTLRATGAGELVLDGKDEIAESSSGREFVYDQFFESKMKQSGGLKTPDEHHSLQDFVFSSKRYEIRQASWLLLPIILQKRSYTYDPLSRKPIGYTFEYEYAFKPTTYAKFR